MNIQPGQVILNGKYRIEGLIGEGGMARVWLAEELTFGHRRVAIKEPRIVPQSALAQEIEERYRREVQVCAALEQAGVPNIVRALTAEPSDGGLLLVMEYMPGSDLAARLREHPGGLQVEEAVSITLDLLRALEGVHAHELEIVHRDIKPSNVLFDGEGRAHLADFGLAQLAGMSGRSQLAGGQHPGTPMYMAPEQETSTRTLTPAADVFALGCVLFEMLTGQRYKRHQPGTRVSALRPDVPPWLDDIVAKALEEDPWQRWRDAGEMAAAIEQGAKQWKEHQARLAELDHWYKEAQLAVDDRRWEAALLLCDRIEQLEPGFRHIRESRRQIESSLRAEREAKERERARQVRLAGWYTDAEKLAGKQPQEALALVARIQAEAPGYPNLDHLERKARSMLSEQRRQQERAQAEQAPVPERMRAVPAHARGSTPVTAGWEPARRSWLVPVLLGAAAIVVLALGGLWATGELTRATPTPEPTARPTSTPTSIPMSPDEPAAGDPMTRSKDGMEMVYVPAGAFEMGSDDGADDEQPVHKVTLDGYWIDRTEVTNAQYQVFVSAKGHRAPTRCDWGEPTYEDGNKSDHPVVCVSWDDASAYCEWAGGRLPTEAEWEKAARGTDGRVYPWGNEFDCAKGNFDDETTLDEYVVPGGVDCDGYERTAPVGSYAAGASPYGALDMAGNVWEWVGDWYGAYPGADQENPTGPATGEYRVLRGGSWSDNYPYALRGADRNVWRPGDTSYYLGFRCARGSQQAP